MTMTSMTTNLMVADVAAAVQFYEDLLGFAVVDAVQAPDETLQFAILATDDLLLMLQKRESLMAEYPTLATDVVKPSITLYCQIDDFEAFYQNIKASYPILTEVHTTFYGSQEFAIADVDGYVLTFAKK